jgi:hypothetical protein
VGGPYPPPPRPPVSQYPGAATNVPEQSFRAETPRAERILAVVGNDEEVLLSDVLPPLDHYLRERLKDQPQKVPADMIEKIRRQLLPQFLKMQIESRQVLVTIKQKVPKEHYEKIRENFASAFEEKQVKDWLTKHKLANRRELELKAFELFGSDLERVKRDFIDQVLAANWISQQIPREEDVAHADLVAYYRQHEQEYEFKAKVLWEQITVEYGAKRSRDEAWKIIANAGNAVARGRALFADVARSVSEGVTAKEGGAWDWTEQGALVSDKIDAELFNSPLNVLSRIIDDNGAFHIVRVKEHKPAGKTSFEEAQKDIKEKIKKARMEEKRKAIVKRIREQVPVRNFYEESLAATGTPPNSGSP